MTGGHDDPKSPRRRRVWSEADDAELHRLVAARQPTGEIARQLGRTIDAVRGRAVHLGLALPSSLRPWRAAVRRSAHGGSDGSA